MAEDIDCGRNPGTKTTRPFAREAKNGAAHTSREAVVIDVIEKFRG